MGNLKIGFDAKRFFTNQTGLGSYSRFIVDALSYAYPDENYYLFTPIKKKKLHEAKKISGRSNIITLHPSGIWQNKVLQSAWRSFRLNNSLKKNDIDIYHGLSNELPFSLGNKIKYLVTIHDLLFLRYPELYKKVDASIYLTKVKYACKLATTIIAISKQTRLDLIEYLNIAPSKIEIIYQGCHSIFKQTINQFERDKVISEHALPKEYILSVGTLEKRKNTLAILKAVKQANIDFPVVLIGKKTVYQKELETYIEKNKMKRQVFILNKVSIFELSAIYQSATLFVYPSIFEGFGIPNIEAQHSGLPVITSLGSCMQDSAGDHSMYFDPKDIDELGDRIKKVLSDKALQTEMIRKGLSFVRKFEPNEIAKDLMNVYRSLVP